MVLEDDPSNSFCYGEGDTNKDLPMSKSTAMEWNNGEMSNYYPPGPGGRKIGDHLHRNMTTHSILTDNNGFNFSTDDESTARCITNISSASSSISWAEDAVEAELTQKIFMMWEDIQLTCTTEVEEKPLNMPLLIFDECLSWKRAFPNQDLTRFSRYDPNEELLVPPKVIKAKIPPRTSSIPCPSPAESFSSQSNCSTPNPEKSSLFVTSWLADCQLSQKDDCKSEGDEEESVKDFYRRYSPSPSSPSPSSRKFLKVNNNSDLRNYQELLESDDPSLVYLKELNLLPPPISAHHQQQHRRSQDRAGQLRVQRPISSSVKGHLLTPLPTKSSNGTRFPRDLLPAPPGPTRTPSSSLLNYEGNNYYYKNYGINEDPHGDTTMITAGAPRTLKGRTAPVQPVCPPAAELFHNHPNKARSSGPRRTAFSRNMPNNDFRTNGTGTSTTAAPTSNNNENNNPESNNYQMPPSGSRISSSGSFQSITSSSTVTSTTTTTRFLKTSFSSGFVSGGVGVGTAGLPQTTSWSRHSSSSINESSVFHIPNSSSSNNNNNNNNNDDSPGIHFVKTQVGPNSFDKKSFNISGPDSGNPVEHLLSRPHLKNEEIYASSKLQPVRPFLYWLLDKVSPT